MMFEDAKVDYSMGALKYKDRKRRRKTTRRGKTEMEHFFRGVPFLLILLTGALLTAAACAHRSDMQMPRPMPLSLSHNSIVPSRLKTVKPRSATSAKRPKTENTAYGRAMPGNMWTNKGNFNFTRFIHHIGS